MLIEKEKIASNVLLGDYVLIKPNDGNCTGHWNSTMRTYCNTIRKVIYKGESSGRPYISFELSNKDIGGNCSIYLDECVKLYTYKKEE